MRRIVLAALLIGGAAAAAVTGEWQVNLLRSSTKIETIKGPTQSEAWNACVARIPALADGLYKCQTPVYVARKATDPAPPPPTCPPPPASSKEPRPCPAGTTGTWQQTSTSTVGPPPACTVTTTWSPSSPPAGACTTPQPPPPPPTGDTIRNGQLFNIVGSGFGMKPSPGPVVFDDFEAGSGKVEGRAAKVGTWGSGEWSGAVTYDTTQPLQGSKVARHTFANGNYNASLYLDRTTTTVYADFWMRVVPRSTATDQRNRFTRNFKAWRFYGANDDSLANEFVPCDSPGWVGGPGAGTWVAGEWSDRPWKQWEHYRIVMKTGAGGRFSQHRNGVADIDRATTAGGTALGVRIGHYFALDNDANCNSGGGADVYTDLVYVDTSLARVYLADAPTLGASKHTAIQIPTAWADGAVTFTGNTHGFRAGDAAYVIVVNAGNAERKTQPVTVQ